MALGLLPLSQLSYFWRRNLKISEDNQSCDVHKDGEINIWDKGFTKKGELPNFCLCVETLRLFFLGATVDGELLSSVADQSQNPVHIRQGFYH